MCMKSPVTEGTGDVGTGIREYGPTSKRERVQSKGQFLLGREALQKSREVR
jgi:hypothetical protein